MNFSVALPRPVDEKAAAHLLRPDGDEDLCFALWHPSRGAMRFSALITELLLPEPGDRDVHGNAAFFPQYFERAVRSALEVKAGLALMHSHPLASTWQGLSRDDAAAENGRAASVKGATGLPLIGLTLAGRNRTWSARAWEKTRPREYQVRDCLSVRVVGKQLRVSRPLSQRSVANPKLARTTSAWGDDIQHQLEELHIGVVGLGSVGSIVAEALVRMGIRRLSLIDFDAVEEVNLDRVLHSYQEDADARRPKVQVIASAIRRSATHPAFECTPLEWSIVEEEGYRAALDCDVLFSCVDRPWPRSVLNLIATAHLIPVIDGGLRLQPSSVAGIRRGDMKALTATVGRACMECVGQFSPEFVSLERDGYLDDPHYIESLPADHPVRARQNVFGFSLPAAGLEVMQLLAMVVTPTGLADPGVQNYHFIPGSLDRDWPTCSEECLYARATGRGDDSGYVVTGRHPLAEKLRTKRDTSHATRRL